MIETLPFLSLRRITSQVYADIDSLEKEVYSSKLGRKLDYDGKSLPESSRHASSSQCRKQEEDCSHIPQSDNATQAPSVPDILSL